MSLIFGSRYLKGKPSKESINTCPLACQDFGCALTLGSPAKDIFWPRIRDPHSFSLPKIKSPRDLFNDSLVIKIPEIGLLLFLDRSMISRSCDFVLGNQRAVLSPYQATSHGLSVTTTSSGSALSRICETCRACSLWLDFF